MIDRTAGRWISSLAVGALTVLASSCNNPTRTEALPPTAPTDHGRFQVVSSTEPGRGTVMFLVDTKDGSTWIYRGPQGGAFNGFWSNIPKLQVSDDYWREALSKLIAPGPAPVPTDLPPAQTPPATNAPPPSPKPTTPPAPPPAK